MMHWRANRMLSEYLDDELSTDEADHVQRHVEACERCRLTLREFEVTAELLGFMPRSLVPMEARVAARIRMRSLAGIPADTGFGDANGLAFRAAAATATMAIMLILVSVGPLSVQRPERRHGSGMLPSAERESTLLASNYEPPGGWGRN